MMHSNPPQPRPDTEAAARGEFHVVGVGTSAGGLEALEALFGSMPLDSGMAFVVIQHLSPDFKSHMEELRARKTRIPVHVVEDQAAVQPNTIYLLPARMEPETLLGVDRIFQLLHRQYGIDFSLYKSSTFGRRLQRRMDLVDLPFQSTCDGPQR